jgi:hypothetical protein
MMKKVYQLKKMLLLAIAVCTCQGLFAQPQNLYAAAFHYIKGINTTRELFTVDTTVNFPLYGYRNELSAYWRKSRQTTDNLVDSADWENENNLNSQLDFLKELKAKGEKPVHLIYFSKVSMGNILIAEIMPKKAGVNLRHEDQSLYNDCIQYLFIFDENGKIKKVFVHGRVRYN